MQIEQIIVENVKCSGCANSIQSAINKMVGVSKSEVKFEEATTVVIEHEGKIDRATFIEKLTSLGYPETGNSTLMIKAKSFVSCAVGRLK
ncbi:MAG: heavy-metal-associated domain-containing protein [Saprospiraceae bacterium]